MAIYMYIDIIILQMIREMKKNQLIKHEANEKENNKLN